LRLGLNYATEPSCKTLVATFNELYGKNGLLADKNIDTKYYLDVLNSVSLDEIKILDSILESRHPALSIRQYYTDNRQNIENHFKSMSIDEYKTYLDSINLPHIEIDKIIDHFIIDGEKREQEKELHFNFAYEQFKNGRAKSKWELSENGSFINKLCYFDNFDGLRINLLNDLIWVSGPFSVFSVFSCFQKTISITSREYYHSYFKKLFQTFKSDFILYAHEWAGLDDEEDKDFNLAKLKEQSNWEITSSDSINTMDRFYCEQL
jgi:hypothetical protein